MTTKVLKCTTRLPLYSILLDKRVFSVCIMCHTNASTNLLRERVLCVHIYPLAGQNVYKHARMRPHARAEMKRRRH